jgi:hypothetical protein
VRFFYAARQSADHQLTAATAFDQLAANDGLGEIVKSCNRNNTIQQRMNL